MKITGYLKGLLFISSLFFSITFGSIFILFPSYVLLLINKQDWFRRYSDMWAGLWLTFSGAMLELLFGTKIVVKGDKVDPEKDSPLIIINHRCRLDWMFYWMVVQRTGRLCNEKIIMKRELKFIPGVGWCMQNALYCFLKRIWEEDKSYLDRFVNYFIDFQYPLQLFLFPEGTDLCKESLERSDKFAEKNNLVKYNYVLHPRVKGFNYLVQKMRSNILNTVYDVTVGFPVNVCYGEMDLLGGNFPKEIHFLLKRYELSDLPLESDQLDAWCIDRWAEKEKLLKRFYEKGRFDDEHGDVATPQQEQHTKIVGVLSLLFWFSFTLFSFYICWASKLVLYFVAVSIVFYSYLNAIGGADLMLLNHHEQMKKTK